MDTQIVAYTLSGEPIEIEPIELGFSLGKFFKRVAKKTIKFTRRVIKKAWVPVRKTIVNVADNVAQRTFGIRPSELFKKPTRVSYRDTSYKPTYRTHERTAYAYYSSGYYRQKYGQTSPVKTATNQSNHTSNMLPLIAAAGIALYMWRKR